MKKSFYFDNLFGRVLVHPLLLPICLFVHRIEKEDHCIRKNRGIVSICEITFLVVLKKHLFKAPPPLLAVIHK